MDYIYLGNFANIPDYTTWTTQQTRGQRLEENTSLLQTVKPRRRGRAMSYLAQQHGYDEVSVETLMKANTIDFARHIVNNYAVVQQISNIIGFRKPQGRVQNLEAGSMVPWHFDELEHSYINDEEQVNPADAPKITDEERVEFAANRNIARRVFILLEDWKHGQSVFFENSQFERWRAGDVIFFDWQTKVHGTSNTGWWSRPLLRLSGLTTDKFDRFLSNNTPFQLDYNQL